MSLQNSDYQQVYFLALLDAGDLYRSRSQVLSQKLLDGCVDCIVADYCGIDNFRRLDNARM